MAELVVSKRAKLFLQSVKASLGLSPKTEGVGRSRSKYKCGDGETVDQIAEKRLGDRRLASLIITINRSAIIIDRHGIAIILPGTMLEMPAMDEVRLYQERYFTRARVSSAPKFSVNPNFLNAVEVQPIDTQTVEADDNRDVIQLSDGCRLYVTSAGSIGAAFNVKLQASIYSGYITIAAYESVLGRTRRILFKPDGGYSHLNIELPAEVAKEMAKRDFRLNWKRYCDNYFFSQNQNAPMSEYDRSSSDLHMQRINLKSEPGAMH